MPGSRRGPVALRQRQPRHVAASVSQRDLLVYNRTTVQRLADLSARSVPPTQRYTPAVTIANDS